jgi:hypothetical protein
MVWRFDKWFNVYDHWYVKLFWLALVFTVLFELAFVYQLIVYGREELRPSWSQAQFAGLIVGGVAVALVAWSFVKHLIGDPLYIDYFHIANLAGPIFAAALLLRRGSRAGQTPLIWGAYAVMEACWFLAVALWFGSDFRSFEHISVYVLGVGLAAGMCYVVSRMPAYVPADHERPAGPVGRAAPRERVATAK